MPRVSLSEKDSPEAVQVLHSCPQEMQVPVCPQVEGVRKRTQAALPVFTSDATNFLCWLL